MIRPIVATLFLTCLAARAQETVTARLEWEPGHMGSNPWRYYPLRADPHEGVEYPEKLAMARYGALALGEGRTVHLAVELGREGQPLRVDTDLDGDLTDESPRIWKGKGAGLVTKDTVVFDLPGEDSPLPVDFGFYRRGAEATDEIGVSTRIHRLGVVLLGDRLRPVAVVDGNGDLRFDSPEHDRLYLDEDGSGKFETRDRSHELFRAGRPFQLRGAAYVARVVDPLGGAIEFSRVRSAPKPPPRRYSLFERKPSRKLGPKPSRSVEELVAAFGKQPDSKRLETLRDIAACGTEEAFRFLLDVAQRNVAEKVRNEAIQQTGYTDFAPYASQLDRFVRSDAETALRLEAIYSLHLMDAPIRSKTYAAILKEAKDDRDKKLVSVAARFLGYMSTPKSRKLLLTAFKQQEDLNLRLSIYNMATQADAGGPWRDLCRLALEGKGDVRIGHALWDLWCLRDPSARPAAIEILRRRKMDLRLARKAIRIVSYQAESDGMPELFDWSIRGKNEVWWEIAHSLERTREPNAIKALVKGLRHENGRARGLAVQVLSGVEGKGVTAALAKAARREKALWVQQELIQALGDRDDPAVLKPLMAIAKDEKAPARPEALAALARVGAGDAGVRKLFAKMLESGDATERIYALDVAARSGDLSLLSVVLGNLGHKEWRVRIAAVECLRGYRVVEAIGPLVNQLESEKERRVRDAIGETLFRLTGQEYFDIAKAWRGWWEANRDGFEIAAKPPSRTKQHAGTVARFYGVPVVSDRVCFVIDRSGSMDAVADKERSRLDVAKAEVLAATGRLDSAARVNVIFFEDKISSWKKGLVPLHAENRASLKKHLSEIEHAGHTNLYDALALALDQKGVDTIFLLSDGSPNRGTHTADWSILQQVRRLNQTRRVAIHTIAIGRDSELMRNLAAGNGGRYVRR